MKKSFLFLYFTITLSLLSMVVVVLVKQNFNFLIENWTIFSILFTIWWILLYFLFIRRKAKKGGI